MNYIQVIFSLNRETEWKVDLFKDSLLTIGFDSFVETQEGFEAYCPEKDFQEESLKDIISASELEHKEDLDYTISLIPDQNWNEVWEQTSPSVQIGENCLVRKETQETIEGIKYDIIINPRQSFGTATHPTTYMILEQLLSMQSFDGKEVMDMGCGTAVLAILAKKMGAEYVEAIDNDKWAYENAVDNVAKNNLDIVVKQGSCESITEGKLFDIFIANINLNILTDNLHYFAKHTKPGGKLIMSGFYEDDIKELVDKTKPLGFTFLSQRLRDDWACIILKKN